MPTPIMTLAGVKKRRYKCLSDRCYEMAFHFVSDNKDWRLIHGILNVADTLGRPNNEKYLHYEHAWAEKGDYVYDPSHNYFYLKQEFEADFNARAIISYSFQEACRVMMSFKKPYYGLWHAWGEWL